MEGKSLILADWNRIYHGPVTPRTILVYPKDDGDPFEIDAYFLLFTREFSETLESLESPESPELDPISLFIEFYTWLGLRGHREYLEAYVPLKTTSIATIELNIPWSALEYHIEKWYFQSFYRYILVVPDFSAIDQQTWAELPRLNEFSNRELVDKIDIDQIEDPKSFLLFSYKPGEYYKPPRQFRGYAASSSLGERCLELTPLNLS